MLSSLAQTIKKWQRFKNDYSKATTSKSMFLLYKNRVWMGKTRIAPNALKIEVESYDINL